MSGVPRAVYGDPGPAFPGPLLAHEEGMKNKIPSHIEATLGHSTRALAVLFIASFLALFQNCSKTSFSAGSGSSGSDNSSSMSLGHSANSCDGQLQTETYPLKVLFIVDMSGSNYESPGTDPDKSMRAGSIQTFFDSYKSNSHISWGFIGFQGTSAFAFINKGSTSNASFSSSANAMQSAINTFEGMIDDDKTPYKAALNLAQTAISGDNADSNTKYVVVFLSDGMPSDYVNNSSGDQQLDGDVSNLVNLLPGRISFNTIYYGPTDATASQRLRDMATAGSGQFLDTNNNPTGKTFYISDNISIPGATCN